MSSSMHPMTDAIAPYEPLALPVGPVIVATDAGPDSDGTIPLAQVLATHTRADVEAVSVLGPFTSSLFAADVLSVPSGGDVARRIDREAEVRAQLVRLSPDTASWPVHVREGDTAQVLVDHAMARDARVILVGRGRHGALSRFLGSDLVFRLLQLGDRPVLAVDPELVRLPGRVVIGTDFSEYSHHAARIALTMVAPDATIFLVNVGPAFEESDGVVRDRAVAYREQARGSMARMRESLQRPEMQFEEVFLSGNAADELLRFADDTQADLVVSSTHGHGFIRRMLLGSVANGLLRGAHCSVLCVPGSAHSHAAAYVRRSERTRAFAPGKQDAELAVFTTRNAGKPCTVLVHQPELGAQTLGHALPLVGATYDPHERTVALMFGASQLAGTHLTHRVTGVSSLELSSDLEGHDRVLRLSHGVGYTLVALE